MFPTEIYIQRRKSLKDALKKGVILLSGNKESAMNYQGNTYPFRQDSTFLYFFGIDKPGLAALLDIDHDTETIYGDELGIEDLIWMGTQEKMADMCMKSGINRVQPYEKLASDISKSLAKKQKIHYLPPYRERNVFEISFLLDINHEKVKENASAELIQAVVHQRSVKDKYELSEMETTMNEVTVPAYVEAMKNIRPGMVEYQVSGLIEGIALSKNCTMAYPVICSVNGHILHNHFHGNKLKKDQLLLIDAGAESPMHYATDITRTYPVSGKFSSMQKDIYTIVLQAEKRSVAAIKPGIPYNEVHMQAAMIIAEGLKDLGLMKGNTRDAVSAGAHALFFPHGLGHMIGLDVHDMENLGEDFVGYDQDVKRSDQFGTAYLRLGKKLQTGYTLTVEPGIYFIPVLIDKWKSERQFREFINYEMVSKYLDFGGVRIEENVVVTENAFKIIGNIIPKEVAEIEAKMIS